MSSPRAELAELSQVDSRFPFEAYEFLWQALTHTQETLGRLPDPDDAASDLRHVSGRELLEGVRQLAREQFGLMAWTVFQLWGIRTTADIGAMVFRLTDAGIWHCSENDRMSDFENVFDIQHSLEDDFEWSWDET